MDPPSLTELDAVLFDAGGTLVELDFAFIAARASRHGLRVEPDALRRGEVEARRRIDGSARRTGRVAGTDEGRRFHYFTVLLESAGVAAPALSGLIEELDAAHAEESLWRVEVEGATATLAALRARGLVTAVVSNSDGRVESILAELGLTDHLSLVVDSRLEGVEKPDPEIFRRALSRLSVEPGRAAYVGDIYSIDALGSRAAGLAPVLLDRFGGYADMDVATVPRLDALLAE